MNRSNTFGERKEGPRKKKERKKERKKEKAKAI
jgi:hypothetical protein